jgi:hypothetical protein
MTHDKKPFVAGDEVLKISRPQWHMPRSYTVHKVKKVHKTGRFVLEGMDRQWRQDGTRTGELTYYGGHTFIAHKSDALVAEIEAERRDWRTLQKVRRLGDALGKIRDVESACEIWEHLPKNLRSMAEDSK